MPPTTVNGPRRRIGLTRKNIYAPLHPDAALRAPTSEDILAAPKSSDDESSSKRDETDDGLSDGSLTGVAKKKLGTGQSETTGNSEGYTSLMDKNTEAAARPLQNPPSHIASTVFTSKKPSEVRAGSQSSLKRLRDETDDEMGAFGSMNSRKAKRKTYGGLSNIHKGSAADPKGPPKAAPTKKKKEPSASRALQAEAAPSRSKSILNLGLLGLKCANLSRGQDTGRAQRTEKVHVERALFCPVFAAGSESFTAIEQEHSRAISNLIEEFQGAAAIVSQKRFQI